MDRQLNVCLLNDCFPPVIDGVANVMLNYAKVLHRDYGNVVVAVPRYPGDNAEYPFPVIRYPSVRTPKTAGYRMGVPGLGIIRELKSYQIDIIHCHCPFVSAMISKLLRQSTKAPIVMTYHTKYDIDIANNFDAEILRSAAKRLIVANIEMCDEVWAVSRGAGENLKSLGYRGDFCVMDNGVDFPKGPAPKSLSRQAGEEIGLAGLPADVPVFLYVGRMMWYKGIRLILEGLLKAKAAGVKFKMVFVGGGEDFGEITDLALSLGLGGECIFAGPISDRERLRAIYSRADMFMFPSTFDTSGIVVREAAACGLASILINGSAAAESTTDGRNAALIDEDSDSLARAVIDLTNNMDLMKSLGRAALDDLYVSWETAIARAYEQYCAVVGR